MQHQNTSRHLTHEFRVLTSLDRKVKKLRKKQPPSNASKGQDRVKMRSIPGFSLPTFLCSSPGRSHK